jgi:hypothetical protein
VPTSQPRAVPYCVRVRRALRRLWLEWFPASFTIKLKNSNLRRHSITRSIRNSPSERVCGSCVSLFANASNASTSSCNCRTAESEMCRRFILRTPTGIRPHGSHNCSDENSRFSITFMAARQRRYYWGQSQGEIRSVYAQLAKDLALPCMTRVPFSSSRPTFDFNIAGDRLCREQR